MDHEKSYKCILQMKGKIVFKGINFFVTGGGNTVHVTSGEVRLVEEIRNGARSVRPRGRMSTPGSTDCPSRP